VYLPPAALVLEIISPGDETWEKLDFYAAHGVEELLIVDPEEKVVSWMVRGWRVQASEAKLSDRAGRC
jgi:Uma2 family endonuclease